MQLMPSWWMRRNKQKKSQRGHRSPWRTYKPWAEVLEDRTVPSVNWINPAGGDWDTPGNWSTGLVPGAGDDVVISQNGITVTHVDNVSESIHSLSSQANIDWQNGSLTLAVGGGVSGAFNDAGAVILQSGGLALDGGRNG